MQHLTIYQAPNIVLPTDLNPRFYVGQQKIITHQTFVALDSYYVPKGPLRLNVEIKQDPLLTRRALFLVVLVAIGLGILAFAIRRRKRQTP